MRQIQLEFILIQLRAAAPTGASEQLAFISAMTMEYGAEIEQLLGTLILIHNGAQDTPVEFDRQALVERIRETLPTDVRIVHGRAPGTCGRLGGDRRLFYGATFLGCDYAIARVFELEPGSIENLAP